MFLFIVKHLHQRRPFLVQSAALRDTLKNKVASHQCITISYSLKQRKRGWLEKNRNSSLNWSCVRACVCRTNMATGGATFFCSWFGHVLKFGCFEAKCTCPFSLVFVNNMPYGKWSWLSLAARQFINSWDDGSLSSQIKKESRLHQKKSISPFLFCVLPALSKKWCGVCIF